MSSGARVVSGRPSLRQGLGALRYVPALFRQVWRTSRTLTVATVLVRAVRAILPVLILYVAKLIIDEVVLQTSLPQSGVDLQRLARERPPRAPRRPVRAGARARRRVRPARPRWAPWSMRCSRSST